MNKNELMTLVAQPVEKVDEILTAMRLKKDGTYTDEHARIISDAIALMDADSLNAKEAVKRAKSIAARLAVQPSPSDIVANPANTVLDTIPQEAQEGLDSVVTQVAQEKLKDLPNTIAKSTDRSHQQVEDWVDGKVSAKYFEEAVKQINNPDLPGKVLEAINAGKSQSTPEGSD